MTDAYAICATFVDYSLVKTRSAFRLVFELPIEQQASVFAALGYPVPGTDIWCGIVLLDPAAVAGSRPPQDPPIPQDSPAHGAGAKNLAKSWAAKEAYRNKTPGEKRVVKAALLIEDARFQTWIGARDGNTADKMLKLVCGLKSKSELAYDEAAQRHFDVMCLEFEAAMNRIAEQRG